MGFSGFSDLAALIEPLAWLAAIPGMIILLTGIAVLIWPIPAQRRLRLRLHDHFGSQRFLTVFGLPRGKGNRVGRFVNEHWEEIRSDYIAVLKLRSVGYAIAVVGLFCAMIPVAISLFD